MDPYPLPSSPHFEQAVFNGSSVVAGTGWQVWRKPLGRNHASIILFGGGGGGGTGAIGANSAAAGGGGGGSGAMTILDIPLDFLPPRLYISVSHAKTGAGVSTDVSTQPNTTANHRIANASGGGAGGNASGATAGTSGSAGAVSSASTMPLGWLFVSVALAGSAGTAGGAALTLPATGQRMTGGSGGGALPAAGLAGTDGGSFIVPAPPSYFIPQAGGTGPTVSTSPSGGGAHGFGIGPEAGTFYYGGTGGSSTHGSATGAGLVQAAGGNGAIGCGGGGMGGALTGSTAAALSKGGAGKVIITCY